MDNSRDHDLRMLHARMHNPDLSLYSRKVAWRSFNKILAQVNDRKLTELRHRLIRARIDKDLDAVEKIELQLKEYTRIKGYEKGN